MARLFAVLLVGVGIAIGAGLCAFVTLVPLTPLASVTLAFAAGFGSAALIVVLGAFWFRAASRAPIAFGSSPDAVGFRYTDREEVYPFSSFASVQLPRHAGAGIVVTLTDGRKQPIGGMDDWQAQVIELAFQNWGQRQAQFELDGAEFRQAIVAGRRKDPRWQASRSILMDGRVMPDIVWKGTFNQALPLLVRGKWITAPRKASFAQAFLMAAAMPVLVWIPALMFASVVPTGFDEWTVSLLASMAAFGLALWLSRDALLGRLLESSLSMETRPPRANGEAILQRAATAAGHQVASTRRSLLKSSVRLTIPLKIVYFQAALPAPKILVETRGLEYVHQHARIKGAILETLALAALEDPEWLGPPVKPLSVPH